MCFYVSQYCTISCFDYVLNKINIISAAEGLWGINVSDEHFLIRGRVIFGDVFLLIPNIAQFSFARKKTERQTDKQTVQFKLKEKKRKKEKRKKKKVKKEKEKGKRENEKEK